MTRVRIEGNYKKREVKLNGKVLSPERSLKVRQHSPDGFLWGYGGSGPTQLSLAILLEYCSNEQDAVRFTNKFKWDIIARLPRADVDFEIDLSQFMVNE